MRKGLIKPRKNNKQRKTNKNLPKYEIGTPPSGADDLKFNFDPGVIQDIEVKGNDEQSGNTMIGMFQEKLQPKKPVALPTKPVEQPIVKPVVQPQTPIAPPNIRKLKYSIRDFYKDDYAKRRQKYHPEETEQSVLNAFDQSKVAYEQMEDNVGGFYNPFEQQIKINSKNSVQEMRPTLVHEMRHSMDDKHGGLSEEEKQILRNAYQLDKPKGYKNIDDEYAPINTALRYIISQDNGGILGDDFDNFIKNADDAYIIRMADKSTGYFNPEENTDAWFKKTYSGNEARKKKALEGRKKKADAIRRALMEVAYNNNSPYQRGYIPTQLHIPNMNYEMA